jgi:hypothetical protein
MQTLIYIGIAVYLGVVLVFALLAVLRDLLVRDLGESPLIPRKDADARAESPAANVETAVKVNYGGLQHRS